MLAMKEGDHPTTNCRDDERQHESENERVRICQPMLADLSGGCYRHPEQAGCAGNGITQRERNTQTSTEKVGTGQRSHGIRLGNLVDEQVVADVGKEPYETDDP